MFNTTLNVTSIKLLSPSAYFLGRLKELKLQCISFKLSHLWHLLF